MGQTRRLYFCQEIESLYCLTYECVLGFTQNGHTGPAPKRAMLSLNILVVFPNGITFTHKRFVPILCQDCIGELV